MFLKKMLFMCFLLFSLMTFSTGCSLGNKEERVRTLEFTVLSEDRLPTELATLLADRKESAFKVTYSDNEFLYICVGYGEQPTGGYSIAVDDLYLTDSSIYVQTTLIGPSPDEKSNQTPSYPFIVIKTEYLEQPVIIE